VGDSSDEEDGVLAPEPEARSKGDVARRGERPRKVLDSSARTDLTLARVMLRSLLRPRPASRSPWGRLSVGVSRRPVRVSRVMVGEDGGFPCQTALCLLLMMFVNYCEGMVGFGSVSQAKGEME
jgi:hypothetical protein